MAEGAVVGALRVTLGLDTATFEEGIKSASDSIGSVAKHMVSIAGGIQIQKTLESMVSSFMSLSTSAIKTGEDMFKASQKFGVPVEQLYSLRYAADLAGISFEGMTKSFGILSKNINQAAGA